MSDLIAQLRENLSSIEQKYGLKWDKVAVGVSGGADSLALALLLQQALWERNSRIVALTVNHYLREEADAEAAYVARLMAQYGIEHHILDWRHEEIDTGLEEKAREARYSLLEQWCKENGFANLMTAHHQKDQAETFIMRLQRGSGADGLASIAPASVRHGLNFVRPLLEVSPEKLRLFLRERNVVWMEDASNGCDDFLRVRIRKLLPLLEDELGLSEARIAGTARALNDVREYFGQLCKTFIAENVRQWEVGAVDFAPEKLNALHLEVRRRVLAILLKQIGNGCYAPTYDELNRLCRKLEDSAFSGCTLGRCELLVYQKNIWIIPEHRENICVKKKEWENFAAAFPAYARAKIPYKLKKILVARNKTVVF